MNREIKFRAWVAHQKQFWYPGTVWRVTLGADLQKEIGPDIILQQFTGLKDKNGKDVYEGDIVACQSRHGDSCLHEVVWEAAQPFANMGCWNLSDLTAHYDWIGGEEIRGNIYENPELLKS